MSLTEQQKFEIKKIITDAITKKLEEYKLVGDVKPFHERLFSKEIIRKTSFLHSCSTTIGVTLFQNIAYVVAKGNKNFKKVEKQLEVRGNFSSEAKSLIEDIIYDLGRKTKDSNKIKPNIKKEIKQVLKVSGKGQESTQITDLFIVNSKSAEIYIEIKTIKPNKGECEKAKRLLLKIVALVNKPVTVLVGMGYNPYDPQKFSWPLPLNYFNLREDLLVGEDFWDFLGGPGAYRELLNIFEIAGKELKEKIENKIKELTKLK